MDKVEQQVNDVLRRYCWCDSPEREQRLKDDLGIDSLRLVEVLVALEEEFGVPLFIRGKNGLSLTPEGELHWEAEVPPGLPASARLPGGRELPLAPGRHILC